MTSCARATLDFLHPTRSRDQWGREIYSHGRLYCVLMHRADCSGFGIPIPYKTPETQFVAPELDGVQPWFRSHDFKGQQESRRQDGPSPSQL